jgi:hypothetical protein
VVQSGEPFSLGQLCPALNLIFFFFLFLQVENKKQIYLFYFYYFSERVYINSLHYTKPEVPYTQGISDRLDLLLYDE